MLVELYSFFFGSLRDDAMISQAFDEVNDDMQLIISDIRVSLD
jgi:hypothetical protein